MTTLVVGLDLSMTSTGVAVIELPSLGRPAVQLSRHRSKPTLDTIKARGDRLTDLAAAVIQVVMTVPVQPTLVVVEAPLYAGQNTGSSHDRAGLWWLVMARLSRMGLPCVEIGNSKAKKYATGKGSGPDAGKDQVLAAVIKRYGHLADVRGNDEADSLVLAAMGCRALDMPIETDTLSANHLAAMKGVQWPWLG